MAPAAAGRPVAPIVAVTPPRPEVSPVLLAAGYLVFALAGVLTAAIEVLLVPTRWGSTLIPLAPVLAVLTNLALPTISRGFTDTMLSAAPPVIGWVLTALVLSSSRPEGDVLLPAGDTAITSYALLLGGALAGIATVARSGRTGGWQTIFGRTGAPVSPPAAPGSDSGGAR